MIRPLKYGLLLLTLAAVIGVSFAGGRRLRQVAAGPIRQNTRVASTPEALIGNTETTRPVEQDDSSPAETFLEVLKYVKSDYVDRVTDDKKLGFGAVRTMLMSLDDPKTRFLEPEQRKMMEDQLEGRFVGIGVTVTVQKQKKSDIEQRRLTVVAPAPGGPADKAGVRAGDIITDMDGKWVIAYDPRQDLNRLHIKEMDEKLFRQAWKDATKKLTDGISLPKALEQLGAKDGKALALTIERPGAPAPIKISVTTAATTIEPVEYAALNERVGYLRVTQFNDRATEAFTKALDGAKHRAWIVDLRDNAGGPVTSALKGAYGSAKALLARLTKGGQVGLILRKNGQEPIAVNGSGSAAPKIVVLVNGGTANLAEVAAAALKEKAGATVIGARTFGDAVMQKLVPLRDGAAMTLTTGKFLTSTGFDFSGKGIPLDIPLATGAPRSNGDSAVQRALSALSGA